MGQKAVSRLYDLLESGKKTETAVNTIAKEYSEIFTLPGLKEALVEAVAYGYGIVPEVLTSTQQAVLERAVNRPWSGDGMTLSKKLHGSDIAMREAIIAEVSKQLKLNASWQSAARALYDGYNSGHVVREQVLPNYLQTVRKATAGSVTQIAAARKAVRNIERLANKGAPTRMLKAVYEKLLQQAQKGSAEALEKACWVAVQEKSRYVADRIIRTEMARAWADGFFASAAKDADVIAYRWKLSTRHPVYDVCDMLLKADMFGMGAGVFPKDKVPSLPVHPHCMCSLVEVYEGDLNAKQLAAYKAGESRVKQAGDNYLSRISQVRRQQLLGIDGVKAWASGADWQRYMRGWNGLHKPSTRLQNVIETDIINKNKYHDFESMEEYLKQKYDIKLDSSVKNLHYDSVSSCIKGIESVIDEYSDLSTILQKVTVGKSGVMSCTGKNITFNPTYFSDDKLTNICVEQANSGWWTKNTSIVSIGVHEAGHAVERLLIDNNPIYVYEFERIIAWQKCTEAKKIVSKACENIKKTLYGKSKRNDELVKSISQYATKSKSETMAEAFADVYANGDNANPLSIEIKKLTKELLEKYKGGQ